MSRLLSTIGIGGAVLLLAGAAQSGTSQLPPLAAFTTVSVPAGEGSAEPSVAVDRAGRAWLSWLQPKAGGGHTFLAGQVDGASVAAPMTIAEGANFLANWADFPAIFFAADGTMAAHWLERGAQRAAYGIRLKTSRDQGRTWSAPVTPHRDASAVEHGFVSFFDDPRGGVGLAWLDGREMAAQAGNGHGGGNMTLRATTVRGETLGDEILLDGRVCDCCQTAAARTTDGIVVAYRDRSDASSAPEIRDISVVRYASGKWSAPTSVHDDGWELTGCPVNGPAIAAAGQQVVVAWFTDQGRTPRVQAAFSSDGGRTFSSPLRLNVEPTLGRVDVVMAGPDRALVSFIERVEPAGARLVVREVRRDGQIGPPAVVSQVSRERASGFARMAVSQGRLIVAWTDAPPKTPTRVRAAAAALK
jgi:hypothetical protein